MANLTKRIIDLQTTSTLGSDDYVMVDGATNGTKKYLLKDILDEIEDIKEGTALATGAVTTDKLAAGAVTNAKIGDGAVDTTNIADDAVTAAKIDDGAVGTDALAANAVTGAKIATGAVGTGNIASGAVTLDKIASDSNATSSRNGLMSSADKAKLDGFSAASNYALKSDIVGAYIFKGSVNTESDLPSTGLTVGDVYNIIAASSYGESGANVAWTGSAWDALGESFDISDGAIDTEQLADGAVTNDKLAEEAMTTVSPTGTIYDDSTYGSGMRQGYAVTFGNSDTTITLPKVNSDLLIDVENIPTIPEKKIGSGAITANKIAAGAVGTEKLANSAVTTDKLATAAVSTDKIASLAVTTNKIAAGAVDNSKLANNAVGTAQIANGAVTSEKLGSDVTTTINAKAAASDVTALSTRVDEELDEKADVYGYYATMTVGAADNLTGRGDGVSGQYLYRTAGGDEDIADGIANIRSIKGQTLVWNQLCKTPYSSAATTNWNGVTVSVDSNNYVTMSGTITKSGTWMFMSNDNVGIVAGHKYLISGLDKIEGLSFRVYSASGNVTHATVPTATKRIITPSVTSPNLSLYMMAASSNSEVSFKGRPQFFDLTLMFGAGNEPATVAEFEALFPKAYYPYSETKMLPVDIRGIETVGFNLLDLENATSRTEGSYRVIDFPAGRLGECIMTLVDKDPSVALPSDCGIGFVRSDWHQSYGVLVARDFRWVYINGLKNNRSNTSGGIGTLDGPYLLDSILVYPKTDEALDTILRRFDICVNFQWSGYRNGEYEEHWNSQREIPVETYFPDGMRSAGSVADELTPSKAVTRVGVVDLGTLTWGRAEHPAGSGLYRLSTSERLTPRGNTANTNIACAQYSVAVSYGPAGTNQTDMSMCAWDGRLYVRNDTYTTAADFKTAMSGVMLYYELAEPTEVTIEPPLNLSYKVSDFGTEKVMVNEEADAPQSAPPIIQTAYGINATDTVRRLPTQYISHESFQQFVAALQSAVGITVTETWDENDGRYEYTVTQTGE